MLFQKKFVYFESTHMVEGQRESTPSRLWTVSVETDTRFKPPNPYDLSRMPPGPLSHPGSTRVTEPPRCPYMLFNFKVSSSFL